MAISIRPPFCMLRAGAFATAYGHAMPIDLNHTAARTWSIAPLNGGLQGISVPILRGSPPAIRDR